MNRSELFRQFLQRRSDLLLSAALGLTAFGVYLWTLCPTVYWGDCAELATVAVTMGIPHPTGYPLYCLLAKAWTLLFPFGSLVWRLNVLSAVFGSLAVMCLYGCARAIALPRPLALTAGGLLAFSSTFWQQSLITETYTLAAFFTCLLLFLAARWKTNGCGQRDLILLAVAYGFTLTSHQTNTLFLPGFVGFLLWSDPTLRQLGSRAVRAVWARAIGIGVLPLLIYAYLPLRARMHPAYNWGDVETPFAFYYHVTGRAFADSMFQDPLWRLKMHLLNWVENLPREFSWPLVALCVLGLALFWRHREERPLALLLTWIVLADIGFVINYSIYNAYIYYIPCYAVMSLCAGRCLLGLWRALEPHLEPGKRPRYAAFGAACALALVPTQIIGHHTISLRGNWTCYDYSRNLLESIPAHGILIENGDDTASFGITYLQLVEGQRPDVTLIRRGMLSSLYDPEYGRWTNAWYWQGLVRRNPHLAALYPPPGMSAAQSMTEEPLRRIIRDAVAHHTPVCALNPVGTHLWFNDLWFNVPQFTDDNGDRVRFDTYLNRHYQTAPVGLVTQVFPAKQHLTVAALRNETERLWHSYSLRGVFDGNLQKDEFLKLVALNYGNGSLARAEFAYDCGDVSTAVTAYKCVLSLFECDTAIQGLARCQRSAPHTVASAETR